MRFCGTGMVSQTRSGCCCCCWCWCWCWEEVTGAVAATAADGRWGRGAEWSEGEGEGEEGLVVVVDMIKCIVRVGVRVELAHSQNSGD
jgi:hypothetical protein